MKATRFYNGAFYLGDGNVTIYSYDEDGNSLTLYKNQSGVAHNYPIVCGDVKHVPIFVEKGVKVRVKIVSNIDNSIVYEGFLNRLEGKDGGDPDPNFNPTEEELEKFRGRDGEQGLTKIGEEGKKGKTGGRGADSYNRVDIKDTQTITIPKGIKEIYVTAVAGGGSAAKFGNSMFCYMTNNNTVFNDTNKRDYVNYRYSADGTLNTLKSKNYETPTRRNLVQIYFYPSSGYAGDSVYMKKIRIVEIDVEHKLSIEIGKGGRFNSDPNILDGGDGTDTVFILDDKEVLRLKGGKGGKNKAPNVDDSKAFIPYDFKEKITENFGYRRVNEYIRYTTKVNKTDLLLSYSENEHSKTKFVKTTFSEAKNGIWTSREVYVQCSFKYQEYSVGGSSEFSNFALGYCSDLKGQISNFGKLYSKYSTIDFYSPFNNKVTTGAQTTNEFYRMGFGAGGDSCFTIAQETNSKTASLRLRGSVALSSRDKVLRCFVLDSDLLFATHKRLLNNFEPANSDTVAYEPGVKSYIDYDDFFSNYDKFRQSTLDMITEKNTSDFYNFYFEYKGVGFYFDKGIKLFGISNSDKTKTNEGRDGYAYIEFGNISEIE